MAAGRAVRHHALRHRDDARAARREGLRDRRPGHRRHGHAARPRPGLDRLEAQGRLRRPPLARARRHAARRTASSSSGCCPRPERLPEGAQLVVDPDAPVPVPMVGPRHVELRQRRARAPVRARAAARAAASATARRVYAPLRGPRRRGRRSSSPCSTTRKGRAAMATDPGRARSAATADALAAAERPGAVALARAAVPRADRPAAASRSRGAPSAVEAALGVRAARRARTRRRRTRQPDRAVARPRRVARRRRAGRARPRWSWSCARRSAGGARLGRRPVRATAPRSSCAGRHARDVLAKGCALDLHPRAFAPGRCAQTLLARAQVILEQLRRRARLPAARPRRRSPAYLATWLLDAMAEFQPDSSRRMASLRQRSVRATSLNV